MTEELKDQQDMEQVENEEVSGDASYLAMSDEEIMNMAVPVTTEAATSSDPVQEEQVEESDNSTGATTSNEEQAEESIPDTGTDKEVKSEKEVAPTQQEIDYKAAYEKLTTPFKANGKDIQVKNIEDAITLMQMGANYNKKMAALKPNLKLMKILEQNGLLSEEKIGFLIDLEKKQPNAINKLIKDSGLDPLDLDTDKASEYKPNTYTVDEREMALDSVLDEIQHTQSYNRTLDIVGNKWDAASKQVIANHPQVLKVINAHIESGIYDQIVQEIENERVFGRLTGLSDIDAYRVVGDAINARGGFDHLNAGSSPQRQQNVQQQVATSAKSRVDEEKLREKRRAASSTKPAGSAPVPKDFNPLALSDEAFSKLVNDKYL